jgi:hypothetical protein
MTNYLLATGAAWLAASLVALVGQKIIPNKNYQAAPNLVLDEKTSRRRKPLLLLGRLAFALVLVYLLRLMTPLSANWQTGLQFGALAGALVYLPLAFEQFARLPFSPRMIAGSALSGMVQAAAAGLAAALIFSL